MNKEAKKVPPWLLLHVGFVGPVPSKYLKLWFLLKGPYGLLDGNLLFSLEYNFHDTTGTFLLPGHCDSF